MDTWDNDLDRAKRYIKKGDYQHARTILEMMPDNYIARDWLKKLDKLEQKNQFQFDYNSRRSPQQVVINQHFGAKNGIFGEIPTIPFLIICANMLFWGCGIVSMTLETPYFPYVIVGLIVAFFIYIILYYIFWKFYWWMLALSWSVSTAILLFSFAAGMNYLNLVP